ncbi:MAG: hypothetical protein SF187_06260 [Deltaproteobacteria bacterium]|nr:hypothetical protein [Deltaproteobacteria bacterium]
MTVQFHNTKNTRLALALAVCALSACAAGPQPVASTKAAAPTAPSAYYPLEPGWKWAYDVDQDGEAILATFAVTLREGARALVAGGDQLLEYEVKPDGILRPDPRGAADYVLKAPLSAKAAWPVKGGQATVVGWNETIDTPAGKFEGCVTVQEVRDNPDRRTRTSYAPGVGPVVIEFSAMDMGGLHATKARLRGYTRPGEDPLALGL